MQGRELHGLLLPENGHMADLMGVLIDVYQTMLSNFLRGREFFESQGCQLQINYLRASSPCLTGSLAASKLITTGVWMSRFGVDSLQGLFSSKDLIRSTKTLLDIGVGTIKL